MSVSIKDVQVCLPRFWTDQDYPDRFNALPLPHRHFNHALTHSMKALGGLSALSDALDHGQMAQRGYVDPEAQALRDNAGKWLADMVICTARMAEQLGVDLDSQVRKRVCVLMERWGYVEAQTELAIPPAPENPAPTGPGDVL